MDGPNLYFPVWFLYWFPILLPLNYGIKWGITHLVTFIFGKCARYEELYRLEVVLKSLLVTIVAEIAGLSIFYVSEVHLGLSSEFYYAHYTEFSALALGVAMGLNYLLNYLFVFRKTVLSRGTTCLLTGMVTVLTAPYLFLTPSGI